MTEDGGRRWRPYQRNFGGGDGSNGVRTLAEGQGRVFASGSGRVIAGSDREGNNRLPAAPAAPHGWKPDIVDLTAPEGAAQVRSLAQTGRYPMWRFGLVCRYLVCGVLAALCGACSLTQPPRPSTASEQCCEALHTFLERAAPFGFSGAVAYVEEGTVKAQAGYGWADRERGVPITPTTAFDVGSLTKQFTAAAILVLEQKGELSVQDSLPTFFQGVPEDKSGMTLHHLLTHTAGLHPELGGSDEEWISRDSLINLVLGSALISAPGEAYEYSNLGYSTLAAVVEIVSGIPYERFLATELFQPAGMSRTGYVLPDWSTDSVAVGYRSGKRWGTPLEQSGWADDGPTWYLRGNGGLLSTAADMARWGQAMSSLRVLSSSSLNQMFEPVARLNPNINSYYGYGWVLEGEDFRMATHSGSNLIFYSNIFWDLEEDQFLVLLANQQDVGNFSHENSLRGFSRQLLKVAAGEFDQDLPCCAAAMTPSELSTYEGSYTVDGGGRLEVVEAERGLRIDALGQPAINALLVLDTATVAYYDQLNDRAAALLSAFIASDWSEVKWPEGDVDQPRSFVEGQMARIERAIGPIVDYEMLGTVPFWWSYSPSEAVTFVRLKSEDDSRLLRMLVDVRLAVSHGTIPSPVMLLYLPTPHAHEFIAYHPRLHVRPKISFRLGQGENVAAVIISEGQNLIIAHRTNR